MTTIIQHKNSNHKRFTLMCVECGCIFRAERKDFGFNYLHKVFTIKCPECSNIIVLSEWNLRP